VVVEVALHHASQPLAEFRHWLMPASSKLLLQLFELCEEALSDGLAQNEELAVLPGLSTNVGKAQKVKRLRLALSTLFPTCSCEAPKFNQARLVWVQFQSKLPQAFLPFLEERSASARY
jgi:hypothetical protein